MAERYLGHYKDKQEHYVLSRIEGYIPHFRNGSLLVMDTFYYNPVQHFQLIRLNQHLVKAGTLFQQQVLVTKKEVGSQKIIFCCWCWGNDRFILGLQRGQHNTITTYLLSCSSLIVCMALTELSPCFHN